MRPVQRSPQEMVRREKVRDEPMPSPPLKHPAAAGRGRPKADEWNDPWTRANATRFDCYFDIMLRFQANFQV